MAPLELCWVTSNSSLEISALNSGAVEGMGAGSAAAAESAAAAAAAAESAAAAAAESAEDAIGRAGGGGQASYQLWTARYHRNYLQLGPKWPWIVCAGEVDGTIAKRWYVVSSS